METTYNKDIAHCSGYCCLLSDQCRRYHLFRAWERRKLPPAPFIMACFDMDTETCPKLHNMGVHVDVVRAERDYCYFFANAIGGGGTTRGRFTGSRSAANASSIGIAKSRPYENTSPKLLAVPCVPKRISCSTSVSPQTNRDDLPNSRITECRSWRNTATPSRWRNNFAPLTGYCRRSTRPGRAADAGSARTAKYSISSICDATIPNYGRS